jgi:hypothetical protein
VAFTESNLLITITGKKTFYSFKFRIIENPRDPLVPGRNITKFVVVIYDFKQTMEGKEKFEIKFANYDIIQDPSNNTLSISTLSGLIKPFIFVPQDEASAMANSGESMKYTFIGVFSFNLVLKVVLSSSMGFLWSLVHAL